MSKMFRDEASERYALECLERLGREIRALVETVGARSGEVSYGADSPKDLQRFNMIRGNKLLAERIGCGVQRVYMLTSGLTNVSVATLAKLAHCSGARLVIRFEFEP